MLVLSKNNGNTSLPLFLFEKNFKTLKITSRYFFRDFFSILI